MSYTFDKIVDQSFEDAILRVTEVLKDNGFGVLTEIDVKTTLKKKLDVNLSGKERYLQVSSQMFIKN